MHSALDVADECGTLLLSAYQAECRGDILRKAKYMETYKHRREQLRRTSMAGPQGPGLRELADFMDCNPRPADILAACQILKMNRDTAYMDAEAKIREEQA